VNDGWIKGLKLGCFPEVGLGYLTEDFLEGRFEKLQAETHTIQGRQRAPAFDVRLTWMLTSHMQRIEG
jgi:hypothetical protein